MTKKVNKSICNEDILCLSTVMQTQVLCVFFTPVHFIYQLISDNK